MAEVSAAPVGIAPAEAHIRRDQRFWYDDHFTWRQGPYTDDGFWMVPRRPILGNVAVRCVYDDTAPERTASAFATYLDECVHADRMDAEDDYLSNLSAVAAIPPAELVRLRDAVAAGKAGGAADGKPRRARKAAQS